MKPFLLVLAFVAACSAAPSAPAPRLATPSGLEEVALLAKGLE